MAAKEKRAGELQVLRRVFIVETILLIGLNLLKRWLRDLPDELRIIGIVREELRRLLAGRQQNDIRAAVVSQPIVLGFGEAHLRRHVGVGAFECFHCGMIERLFFAVGRGLNLIGRDALFDEVLLDALDAAFAEILVERLGSAGVGMSFNRKLRIGIVFEIFLESAARVASSSCWLFTKPTCGCLLSG